MKTIDSQTRERDARIVKLAESGLSATKIKDRLKLELTTRQIQRITSKHLGKARPQNKSIENSIGHLRPYIEHCLELLGKDPYMCEICDERQTKECDIHHTRYDGATIYDLQYVCRSCNLARANTGLD